VIDDGALWLADYSKSELLRYDNSGAVKAYPLGKGVFPYGLAEGDGKFWFVEHTTQSVDVMSPMDPSDTIHTVLRRHCRDHRPGRQSLIFRRSPELSADASLLSATSPVRNLDCCPLDNMSDPISSFCVHTGAHHTVNDEFYRETWPATVPETMILE